MNPSSLTWQQVPTTATQEMEAAAYAAKDEGADFSGMYRAAVKAAPAPSAALTADEANLQGIANDMWARLDQDLFDSGYTAEMVAQQKLRFNHLIAASGVQVE